MGKIIKKSKIVPLPIDDVWKKWTTREGLLTFFGSDNKMELKIGGAFEIYFLNDNPKGIKGSEDCQILSYLPNQMFSFSWNAPPQFTEIRNHKHKTWVVLHFHSLSTNKTEVTLYHLGWLEGQKWDVVFDYFNEAWELVLNWLENSCHK